MEGLAGRAAFAGWEYLPLDQVEKTQRLPAAPLSSRPLPGLRLAQGCCESAADGLSTFYFRSSVLLPPDPMTREIRWSVTSLK